MLLAVDQQMVEALTPQRSHVSLGERVRPGCPDWSPDDPHAVANKHLIERRRELAVAVTDQEPEVASAFAEGSRPRSGVNERRA
jgi:hypothetical protein